MTDRGDLDRIPVAEADDLAPERIEHRPGVLTAGMFVNIQPDSALQELAYHPSRVKMDVWRVLRCLQLWFAVAPARRPSMLDPEGLAEFEAAILFASYDADIRLPLAVIVAAMRPETDTADRLPPACLAAADWATGQSAPLTMIGLAVAAASASDAPAYWLVAELAAIRYRLRTEGGDHPDHLRLVAWRTALEEEIARLGGPGATRDGLSIIRTIARRIKRPDPGEEPVADVVRRRMGT